MNSGTSADAPAANGTALPQIAIDQPALPSGEGSIAGLRAMFGADNFTGSMPGFPGIDPRYIFGSPSFNLSSILMEALASGFGKAAVTSTLKINLVAGSMVVALGSGMKFFFDTSKKE